jgi:hypothetical protein
VARVTTRTWKPDPRLRHDHTRQVPINTGGGATDTLGLIGPPPVTSRAQDRAAALTLARHASGPDELRELLDILGLTAERCGR